MLSTGLTPTLIGPSLLTLGEIPQDPDAKKHIAELEVMQDGANTARQKANETVTACQAQCAEYQRQTRLLSDEIAAGTKTLAADRFAGIQEILANPSASKLDIAQSLCYKADALKLTIDTYQWVVEQGAPTATEALLEATWKLRQVETLQATIAAALSEANTQVALECVFQAEGRISFVGEKTEAARAVANAASVAEKQARDALGDFRERRAKLDVQRRAAQGVSSK